MQPLSVVLLQGDSSIAQSLVASLCSCFHAVHAVPSVEELRSTVAKNRAEVAILDMELVPVSEVEAFCRDFPALRIVCTHRLADEEMWTAALSAGAADVCPSSDTRGILAAAVRSASMGRSAAA
jgi:DNA-binding NarL/FixJ family response regulator